MKIERNNTWLNVFGLDGMHGICVYGHTVEELEQEIDRTNKKVMDSGYYPEQYLIVLECEKTTYELEKDGKEVFVSKQTSTRVIERYPEKLPDVIK